MEQIFRKYQQDINKWKWFQESKALTLSSLKPCQGGRSLLRISGEPTGGLVSSPSLCVVWKLRADAKTNTLLSQAVSNRFWNERLLRFFYVRVPESLTAWCKDCPESNPLILGIAPPTADLSQVGWAVDPGTLRFLSPWFSLGSA